MAGAFLALAAAGGSEVPADRIFVNGSIWTAEGGPRAEALAVRGNHLAAVGTNAAVRALEGPATEVIDLSGRFVILSEDIVAAAPERILKAKVLRTVMDGRDTFRVPEP